MAEFFTDGASPEDSEVEFIGQPSPDEPQTAIDSEGEVFDIFDETPVEIPVQEEPMQEEPVPEEPVPEEPAPENAELLSPAPLEELMEPTPTLEIPEISPTPPVPYEKIIASLDAQTEKLATLQETVLEGNTYLETINNAGVSVLVGLGLLSGLVCAIVFSVYMRH